MKRGGELNRAASLERKVPLQRSQLRANQSERRKPALVKGLRHVNSIPVELRHALELAAERGWVPSGDLLPKDFRSRSIAFKCLPDEQRFYLTCVTSDGGCWEWLGSLKENGYGQFRFNGRNGYAHRASYEMFVGPIPAGLTVDHQCHNRAGGCRDGKSCRHRRCVNPDHLELTDGVDNARRGVIARTMCARGHELKGGNRLDLARCRECQSEDVTIQSDKRQLAFLGEGRRGAGAKVSDADLDIMRGMRRSGQPLAEIASAFGITKKYASAIINGSRKRRQRHTGPIPAVRRMVARRSDGMCEFAECGRVALHQHHRRPRRMGSSMAPESNLPANLLHLCVEHHEWVESNRERAYADGLLLHMNDDPAAVPVASRHGLVLLDNDGGVTAIPMTAAEEATDD